MTFDANPMTGLEGVYAKASTPASSKSVTTAPPTVSLYAGSSRIRSLEAEIDRLRREAGQDQDPLTSVQWMLDYADRWKELPLIALVRRDGYNLGAVMLRGRRAYGVPVGLFRAGFLCGRAAIVGKPAWHSEIAEIAARQILRRGIAHTVLITAQRSPDAFRAGGGEDGRSPPSRPGPWRMRETRCVLDLSGGMPGLLSRFSYKMRRNFRYYRKRAEDDFKCVFQADLTPEQSRAAVAALHGKTARVQDTDHAMHHEASLRAVPGWFAVGLQDADGNWLSFLAGWRRPDATYVEWQLNVDTLQSSSLSMATRNYWLEHEISLGTPKAVFVGETSPSWSGSCEPDICGDLLMTHTGLIGRTVQNITNHFSPDGRVVALSKQAGTDFFSGP